MHQACAQGNYETMLGAMREVLGEEAYQAMLQHMSEVHPDWPQHMQDMRSGGMMGGGTMGGSAAQSGCPGMTSDGAPTAQIIDEKARELAQKYADKYLQGFTVDKVLPFTGMHMTMYSVELKGPKDEVRVLHINAWGNVMPFGGPSRRAG